MKILTFESNGTEKLGILTEGGIEEIISEPQDIYQFIEENGKVETNQQPIPLDSVKLLAPIQNLKRSVIAVGLNYKKHADEGARKRGREVGVYPEIPYFFCKWSGTNNHHNGEIIYHSSTKELDYECELVIVIGKKGINIPKDKALDYVYGYTIMNEVSARDVQLKHMQWFKGKALDSFGPIGPWIVTKDEIKDANNLRIQTRVNGETRQDSNTNDMIFDISTLIESVSEGLTLQPGDMIATGTPEGVGFAMDPPRTLQAGDVVECEIDEIGILKNHVVSP
ncbi:MAG: fumarylacetoacetate hydrolase family protein [Nitrospinota bacterium]|nr:fumarylacetoacetate hydrolase family protein [Nitrospinota bacterium]